MSNVQKSILDIMTKKEELEIKKTQANASAAIAGSEGDMLTYLYTTLDNLHIHPIAIEESVLDAECVNIIDTLSIVEEITEEKIEEVKIENDENNIISIDAMIEEAIDESKIDILDIQAQ